MFFKRFSTVFFSVLILLNLLSSCSSDTETSETESSDVSVEETVNSYAPIENIYGKTINVEMKIKDFGVIVLELYPEEAPITVENFVSKVREGFYDGLKIHRVVPGFVIQGGEYEDRDSLTPIKGEFSANGITNRIPHQKGVISMARKVVDNDSATCQFFICADTSEMVSSNLDGHYAAFGCVISGIEVIDMISIISRDSNDRPLKDVVIEYIKIVSEDESEELSEDASQEQAEDISDDEKEGLSEEKTEELSESQAEDTSEDEKEGLSEAQTEDTSEEKTDELSENEKEELSEDSK